jgi:hypothetical protein
MQLHVNFIHLSSIYFLVLVVILDMAASVVGGNCDRSIPEEIYTAPNGVKIIGYTDLPSRMATAASTLYANNIANFLLSIGPATNPSFTGKKFYPDYKDPAVREMLIMDKGDMRWPNPNPFVPLEKLKQQDEKHQLQLQLQDPELAGSKKVEESPKNELFPEELAKPNEQPRMATKQPSSPNVSTTTEEETVFITEADINHPR